MIAVIDTNCLLASISRKSADYWLYIAFREKRFEWLISNEILSEYEEKIAQKYSATTADLVLSILSMAPNVTFDEPYFKWNLIEADTDDNKFADLAIAGNADYLVTNDKHFSSLKSIDFPKVAVVSLVEFKRIVLG
ncbi:putative toxin-antitoxin system toxin component, PIN family [Mucilaginibacter psychrotolerans]|uniref:Putative toxin-antitoxin system toxin component, PIN family n=1 Tax=Mucilaginibacter psychrotolerans TaxID=1524096 RepID=A0A4Y8S8Y6_9SPHI|nr:putative toxin-antitoxin system toxin component, PIN family [Mucilaginibacter psychrotolerans]TFF35080.1 putative toxin-antitoxin system toxin component, PIN family [Mucilaginibacter psychrotolerans]